MKTSTHLPISAPESQHNILNIPTKVSIPVQVDLPKKVIVVPEKVTAEIIPVSIPEPILPTITPPTPVPQSQTASAYLNVSSILSQSLDSPDPDFEVKKYMDVDSCSSFSSSMDSIDHPIEYHHASIGSAESIDLMQNIDIVEAAVEPILDINVESKEVLSNENTLISNSSSSSNEGHTLTSDMSPKDTQKRVRKTSWIHSIGNKHGHEEKEKEKEKPPTTSYPATLDKLLNLFHHPGRLFSQTTSPEATMSSSPSSSSNVGPIKPKICNKDGGIVTRESPITGLLHWAANTLSQTKKEDQQIMKQSASAPSHATSTTILQNISPENSINKSTNSQMIIESLPKIVKKELKENISPENTICCEKVVELAMEPSSKVLFQVGDLDDDNNQTAPAASTDEDDEINIEKRDVLVQIDGPLTQKTLGEIAIDSMSILKHQDSASEVSTVTTSTFNN